MSAAPDKFEKIRADINSYEREAMEISAPRASGKVKSPALSREQLIHLVGLLWKLSSAYKDYTRLLEKSLVDIRQNMDEGEEKRALEDAAVNLDRLIDTLQKIEDITNELKE
jgi:hypothetical protein